MSSRSERLKNEGTSACRRIVVNCIGATGGGIVRVLSDLVAAIANDNAVVLYLAPSSMASSANVSLSSVQESSRGRTLLRSVREGLLHKQLKADVRIDIAPGIAPAIHASRRIIIIHDLAFRDRSLSYISRSQRLYRHIVVAWSLRRSHSVVAVSASTEAELMSFYPKVRAKLVTLPLPVSDVFIQAERAILEAPSEKSEGQIVVLAFAHGFNKGVELLIDLLDHRADVKLVLISPRNFWDSSHYAARLRDTRYSGRFELHSNVEDATLITLYERSDVFCMPSRYEGYGLPVAEALCLGVPTVISNLPVLSATGRGYAIAMRGHSVEDLSGAIDRALKMPRSHWARARKEFREWDWLTWTNRILEPVNS